MSLILMRQGASSRIKIKDINYYATIQGDASSRIKINLILMRQGASSRIKIKCL